MTDTPSFDRVTPEPVLKHSGVGIASLTLSIVMGIVLIALVVIAGVMESSTPGGMDENAPSTVLLGLALLGSLGLEGLAFILGLIGLFMQNTKKITAILGVIFSGMIGMGIIFLMILGFMVESAGY